MYVTSLALIQNDKRKNHHFKLILKLFFHYYWNFHMLNVKQCNHMSVKKKIKIKI